MIYPMTYNQPIAPPTNALALAGLILGIIAAVVSIPPTGWLFALLPALLALIFGFVGINTANRLGGKRRGMAIAAVVLAFSPILVPLVKAAVFGI